MKIYFVGGGEGGPSSYSLTLLALGVVNRMFSYFYHKTDFKVGAGFWFKAKKEEK